MSTFLLFYLVGSIIAAIVTIVYFREQGIFCLSELLTALLIIFTSFIGIAFVSFSVLINMICTHFHDPVIWKDKRKHWYHYSLTIERILKDIFHYWKKHPYSWKRSENTLKEYAFQPFTHWKNIENKHLSLKEINNNN